MSGKTGDAEFDAFNEGGEVEGDFSKAGGGAPDNDGEGDDDKGKPKPAAKPAGKSGKPAIEGTGAYAGVKDDDDSGDDVDDEGGDDDAGKPKPKSAAEHQIERLKREKRELQQQLRGSGATSAMAARLEALEARLTGENRGDTKTAAKAAPDPTDADKYPLGHLDDRYIEDKLEWLADQKATKQADSVLQRQREIEQTQAAERMQEALHQQVEEISAKGAELYPDFEEEVVQTGMRGEWKLDQPTFEAAAEADHGAQILYELSQDKKEALRVSRLSPFQQLKFVQERDAEIAGEKKPRTKPRAGDPPRTATRGANSKTRISPATESLSDFEKAWEQDEKGR